MDRRPELDFDDMLDFDGLTAVADQIDEWAEMAEVMGDGAQARRLREHAQLARLRAMGKLD
jgi:hypothetical protein